MMKHVWGLARPKISVTALAIWGTFQIDFSEPVALVAEVKDDVKNELFGEPNPPKPRKSPSTSGWSDKSVMPESIISSSAPSKPAKRSKNAPKATTHEGPLDELVTGLEEALVQGYLERGGVISVSWSPAKKVDLDLSIVRRDFKALNYKNKSNKQGRWEKFGKERFERVHLKQLGVMNDLEIWITVYRAPKTLRKIEVTIELELNDGTTYSYPASFEAAPGTSWKNRSMKIRGKNLLFQKNLTATR